MFHDLYSEFSHQLPTTTTLFFTRTLIALQKKYAKLEGNKKMHWSLRNETPDSFLDSIQLL